MAGYSFSYSGGSLILLNILFTFKSSFLWLGYFSTFFDFILFSYVFYNFSCIRSGFAPDQAHLYRDLDNLLDNFLDLLDDDLFDFNWHLYCLLNNPFYYSFRSLNNNLLFDNPLDRYLDDLLNDLFNNPFRAFDFYSSDNLLLDDAILIDNLLDRDLNDPLDWYFDDLLHNSLGSLDGFDNFNDSVLVDNVL